MNKHFFEDLMFELKEWNRRRKKRKEYKSYEEIRDARDNKGEYEADLDNIQRLLARRAITPRKP